MSRTSARPSTPPLVARAWAACRQGFLAVGAFSIAINVLMLTTSVYLMQISDRVMVSRSIDTLVMLTIGAVVALGVLSVLDMLRKWVLTRLGLKLEAMLGGPVLAASIENTVNGHSPEVQGLRDLATVRGFIAGPVLPQLCDLPMAPFYIIVVFLIHWQLGLITVIGAVTLAFFAHINQLATNKPVSESSKYGSIALSRAQSQIRNADAVRSMGMIEECVRTWGADNLKSLQIQLEASNTNGVIAAMSKFSRLVLQIAILGVGAYLGLQGEVTGGMSIAASIIGGRALAPVEGAIESWKSFIHAREAYEKVCRLLAHSTMQESRTVLPPAKGEVFCDKLVFTTPQAKEPIIKQVSFGILPGTSLALIGATGAGKSTLGKLIVGALQPLSGSVRLDGSDLRNWDPRQLGRSVGFLPQDVELFPGTIAENIARMRPDATSDQIIAAAKFANVHDLIVRLKNGYETVVQERGAPLSGGQRQRVALARAFFGNPKLVVLDEPDAALDTDGEEALMRALANAKAAGITVVVTTQRRNILGALDRVMVLKDGMIELYGPRDQVLERLAQQRQQQQQQAQPQQQQAVPQHAQQQPPTPQGQQQVLPPVHPQAAAAANSQAAQARRAAVAASA
jgi:ATP-binding cassette, subfamily C, bacterial